ncbi:MAG: hypothetical protein GXY37_08115, partial [Chloroflexi bacterium]|nr:hypothetical protein [Chloroflexota bacterium]
ADHIWKANDQEHHLNVTEVRVTSQPAGALFDYVLDDEGKIVPERRTAYTQEVGIVSIGMNTTELLVVREKVPVQRFTGDSTTGVRRLLELVNGQQLYSLGELDTLLRANKLDISQALPIWERESLERLRSGGAKPGGVSQPSSWWAVGRSYSRTHCRIFSMVKVSWRMIPFNRLRGVYGNYHYFRITVEKTKRGFKARSPKAGMQGLSDSFYAESARRGG